MTTTKPLSLLLVLALLALAGFGCSRDAKKDRHLKQANAYLEADEYDKAEIEFSNVLRLDKQPNPAVISQLGQIYQVQGKITRAVSFLKKAKELDPDNIGTRVHLAFLHLNLRQITNAMEEIEFVLKKQPTNEIALEILAETPITTNQVEEVRQRLISMRPQADQVAGYHAALGKLHFRARNLKTAEASFRRAAELNPESNSAYWGLGSVLLAQTNVTQAEEAFKTALQLTPMRSSQRLNYANYKIISGETETGKRLIQETVTKAPDFLPALTRLAGLYLAETNYAECEALLKKALSQDSMNVDAILLNARVKLAQGQKDKSIAELEKLRDMYPNAPGVYFHLGVIHLSNGDTDKALLNLKQAVGLNPDFADAIYLLAEVQIRLKDSMSAITLLEEFLKRYPTAARAQFLLAQAYQAGGRSAEALKLCSGLLEKGIKDPRIPLFAGMVFRQQQKPKEAAVSFDKALEYSPGYLPALQQLVALDVQNKQWPSALDRVQAQIAKEPNSAALHFLLATVHLAKGDFGSAESALLKAIELSPEASELYQMLARMYLQSNQAPKALAKMEERLARKPDDLPAMLTKALIHDQLKDYAQARKTYEKILEIKPNTGAVQNNLAYLLSERFGELDPALALAEKAVENRPGDPAIMDTLGWIRFKRGDYAGALKLLRESSILLSEQVEAQFHLGMATYMMGDESAATSAFQQVAKAGKNFANQDETQRRLALLAIPKEPTDPKQIAELEKALAEKPADTVAAVRLGAVQEKAGAWDKARGVYETALKANLKAAPLILRLARLEAERFNEPAKALELAKQARELAPQDPAVAYFLGRMTYLAKDHRGALGLLEASAERLSGNPEVQYDLAWNYFSLGRVPEALTAMQKALQANPTFSRAEDAKRFVAMVELYQAPAKAVAAGDQVQAAIKANPNDAPALMAAAAIYQRQGNIAAARQACERVLTVFPAFAPANKQLASLYLQVPLDYDKAHAHAMKAREAFPGDPEVENVIKTVDTRRKDAEKAKQLLKETIK